VTTFDVDEYVYSALRAGASGLLLKNPLGTSSARSASSPTEKPWCRRRWPADSSNSSA